MKASYKIKTITLTFSILVIFMGQLFGEIENENFKHLTIQDGLSHNHIICIIQDYEGFIWYGTEDGLNKFNG